MGALVILTIILDKALPQWVTSQFCTVMVYVKFMAANDEVQRSAGELRLDARKQREMAFFELAERFRISNDPAEVKQLGDELGRFVFGESRIEK